MSTLWVWLDIYWKFLSLQHTHDLRQRPIHASTPTVRGHAEACPSTTRTKIYVERVSLGAGISIRSGKMRAVGEGPGRAQVFVVFQLWNQHPLGTISRTIHTIWLKFCMWLPMDTVRTNPYWRFAGKNQNVGQKCDFPTKFLTFFLWQSKSRHRVTLATLNPANYNLQTVSGMRCEIFRSIGLKFSDLERFLRCIFWHFLRLPIYLCRFLPRFFWDPLLKTSPGRFTSQQNHLALNTEFQRSSISGRKVVGLRKNSKFFKIFFSFSGSPMKGNDPPTRIFGESMWKGLV